MSKIPFWFWTIFLIAAFVSCAQDEGTENVDKALGQFRELVASGEYHQVYIETSTLFRDAASEELFTSLLTAVNRKLGQHQSAELAGSRTMWKLRGSRWSRVYKSKFEKGEATETFIFVKEDEQIKLAGYNINSAALVIN